MKNDVTPMPVEDYQPEGPKDFTTEAGIVFRIKPISQHIINQLSDSRTNPQPPMFKTELAGGEVEEMPYDEAYVKGHPTPEVKKAWDEYQDAVLDDVVKYGKRLSDTVILLGTEIEVPGEDSDWQKEQELLGFSPPKPGPERKIYYMLHSVLTDDRDGGNLVGTVLSLGRVNMEYALRVRDSFCYNEKRKATRKAEQEPKRVESEPDIQ